MPQERGTLFLLLLKRMELFNHPLIASLLKPNNLARAQPAQSSPTGDCETAKERALSVPRRFVSLNWLNGMADRGLKLFLCAFTLVGGANPGLIFWSHYHIYLAICRLALLCRPRY